MGDALGFYECIEKNKDIPMKERKEMCTFPERK